MNLTKVLFPILLLIICLNFTGCDDSNPASALPPLDEGNFDISVDLADSGNLGANVVLRNYAQYNWNQTVLDLTILELETGEEYNRSLDFGEIEIDGNKGIIFSSTQQVEGELCYNYRLTLIPENRDEQVSYEDGTCSKKVDI